ncbi:hypothetical protein I4U23_022848 [Adineta vaga]|nr:hypothetical protein I4U23_022848 [Adineta vaga]
MLVFAAITTFQHYCISASIYIDGIWKGQALQFSNEIRFDVYLTIDSKNFIWRIDYGQNGNPTYCGGYWAQTGMHTFRETITYGSCIHGFSSLTPIGDGTNAHFHWWQTGPIQTNGTLTRLHTFCQSIADMPDGHTLDSLSY